MGEDYDAVIIGGGPAGLTAGLYCGRARLKTKLLEKGNLGGTIIDTDWIENWPGVEQGLSGADLAAKLILQVMQYKIELGFPVEMTAIEVNENGLVHIGTASNSYTTKTVIIASGTYPKVLNIPGEASVYHCVLCDGAPFAGKNIIIIGGADTGVTGALYMAKLGCKVTIIEVTPHLNASMILQERLKEVQQISVLCSTIVEHIEQEGDDKVVRLKNLATGEQSYITARAVFGLAGRKPQTEYLQGVVQLDEAGFIEINNNMATNIPGVFAAGDIRSGSPMQAITAAGDGAMAAISAERYINARTW